MRLHPSVISHLQQWPEPADEVRSAGEIQRWVKNVAHSDMSALLETDNGQRLLAALFGNSPYLTTCAFGEPEFLGRIVSRDPGVSYREVLEETRGLTAIVKDGETFAFLSRRLRELRRKASMLLALADITGAWDIRKVVCAQTEFAEVVLDVAINNLLLMLSADGVVKLPDPHHPTRDSGLIVLALGKLGGRELNFSSDIDLIILYDPSKVKVLRDNSAGEIFSRLTLRLVELLETRTGDGYVFRTDLRLRPDPLSTPLAVSIGAAEAYYESVGQNWERAALIKARPIVGDIVAGKEFLQTLEPFIWRKTLDFAALQDIQSIKSQIDSQNKTINSLAGHNVKLGRGGIREIEFFAQTLQLIWGGRLREVRCSSTVDALRALSVQGRISDVVCNEMEDAYWFLRSVENRLQMVEDRQTHELPKSIASLSAFALFMGYRDSPNFLDAISGTLNSVAGHYSALFESSKRRGSPDRISGNLVFTGVDNDPDTISTLENMGFLRPSHVSHIVRRWHRGELRATRNNRAREILTQIMPQILVALARTSDPDSAFIKFDEFLGNLPSGVQLFSLFQASPELLEVVAEIMGTAPRLSGYLARSGYLLDALLQEGAGARAPEKQQLIESIDRELKFAKDFQDVIEVTRRWSGDVKFLTSVKQLRGTIDCLEGCRVLSGVADVLIDVTLKEVTKEFEKTYGILPAGELAVLGFGKLGGEVLTRGSDLDLVFVYHSQKNSMSNGNRAVSAPIYYARLCQRLITALSAQTGQGQLYEIDIRLRPMGSSGPLVSDIARLENYYESEAWTWELMALTRARVITGSPLFTHRIERVIKETLCRVHVSGALTAQVLAMRAKVWRERPPAGSWDIKYAKGGLFDLEFLVQYLQLRHSSRNPSILNSNTLGALEQLRKAGFLDLSALETLAASLEFFLGVQSIIRVCISGVFNEEEASNGFRDVLVRTSGAVDFRGLKEKLVISQNSTHEYFRRIIGDYSAISEA